MIQFKAYQLLDDAWSDGVEDWCRAASAYVLHGGRAWLVTPGDAQANGIRRRLLLAGVSLTGVQFLTARTLRRELCARFGLAAPALGRETLELLLRLHANGEAGGEKRSGADASRNVGSSLRALEDFAAAGWDLDRRLPASLLPAVPLAWLPMLRATGSWLPEVDRQLLELSGQTAQMAPLSLCVYGWDATFWPQFTLLQAACHGAADARLFVPLPRGTSEAVQQAWLSGLEEALGVDYTVCASSGFRSAQGALANRLEGVDLDAPGETTELAAPELIVGAGWHDALALARDFVARWLADCGEAAVETRLAIVAPARNGSAVSLVHALAEAGIAVEDELGELPEPALVIQVQRAIVAYQQEGGTVERLLALLELLNEHAAAAWEMDPAQPLRTLFPLEPGSVRRALRSAFGELQEPRVRVLCAAPAFLRQPLAAPVRAVVAQLCEWPEVLPWSEALDRWQTCLTGFGLSTEALEPGWTRLMALPITGLVPANVFWDHLASVLAGVAPRRPPQTAQRFARIVVTTLEGAAGQVWDGVLFLDAIESVWPVFPAETPLLDDPLRKRLNARRSEPGTSQPDQSRGYLLTSADRAQLDHFRFLEILENCRGPLAFAGAAHDPAALNQELYPNEWVLRCLVESAPAGNQTTPLERWRAARRSVVPSWPALPKTEAAHLRTVFERRRDPSAPFDEALLDFSALTAPDELPWIEPWSARDLEAAWHRPGSLALKQVFGVEASEAGEFRRGPKAVIGRLVHQWVRTVLGGSRHPRRFEAGDWQRALTAGLDDAMRETGKTLRATLGRRTGAGAVEAEAALSPWWQGTLAKAGWAARNCLRSVAEIAAAHPFPWLVVDAKLPATIRTPAGPLRARSACDVLLLDQATLTGAGCQMIDVRSGNSTKAEALTTAKIEQGEGVPLAAMVLAALAQGADPAKTRAGVIEPQTVSPLLVTGAMRARLEANFAPLAERQASQRFGQHELAFGPGHGRVRGESMPLATTAIDATVLEKKATLSTPAPGGAY